MLKKFFVIFGVFSAILYFGYLSLYQKKSTITTLPETKTKAEVPSESIQWPKEHHSTSKKDAPSVAKKLTPNDVQKLYSAPNTVFTQKFQEYRKTEYENSVKEKKNSVSHYEKYQKSKAYQRAGGSKQQHESSKQKIMQQHRQQFEHQHPLGDTHQKKMIVQNHAQKELSHVQVLDARKQHQAINNQFNKGN
jgi:hypothetical protein